MKILHLPTSVGGNSWGLSQAERALGHASEVLISDPNPFQYKADIHLSPFFGRGEQIPVRYDIVSIPTSLRYFLKIRNNYDVFHFNFGKSLIEIPSLNLNLLEIPYYPKSKKIVVTYNGCDARQRGDTLSRTSISACHQDGCYGGACQQDLVIDQRKRKRIERFSRYASHVFALNPDLMYVLPPDKTSFLPYTIHNWSEKQPSPKPASSSDKITIVHAPSQPIAKGTPYLLKAVENLKLRHPDKFDFILIQNLPHEEALNLYQKADLVIDQLLIGWYGAFAVEAMLMEKPVAVFIREDDLQFIPQGMAADLRKTVVDTSVVSIEEDIEYILDNPETLREIGRRGYHYARKWHNPEQIAKEVLSYY